jgi:uncharacterized protein (DUF2147 family)
MRFTSIVVACAVALALAGVAFAGGDPSGTWMSESGKTKVRIAPCGGDGYCGTILAVMGGAQTDVNNPDAAKRSRALVGSLLINRMHPDGASFKGELYDYTSGKTYTGKMTANGDKLDLAGCILGGLICRSETWSRSN